MCPTTVNLKVPTQMFLLFNGPAVVCVGYGTRWLVIPFVSIQIKMK
jgi:hypothetical protein